MTAKEKAEELFNKMYAEQTTGTLSINVQAFKQAKQCAIIAVDEILNIKSVYHDDELSDYWEQVKQEINSL